LGKTGLVIPDITFGSAILGNLFQILPDTTKLEILKAIFEHIPKPVAIDTAGKYGAGLALEVLGKYLRELGVSNEDVVISNKLVQLGGSQ
jgi:D-threo-aldose 1-dehydrogenase